MKWSWRIGRIAGIAVRVHVTFPLFLLWIALSDGKSLRAAAVAVTAVLALFTIVLLHEFGHALMARRFGIATHDITLLPIGGLARLERMPRDPRQELLIAIAGPAVNLVLALAFGTLLVATGGPRSLVEFDLLRRFGAPGLGHVILAELVAANVGLILFNLLPAFPMDGGRVLRALLSLRSHDHLAATRRAALVGRLFAVAFVATGLLGGAPNLVLIGLFVWLAGTGEAAAVASPRITRSEPEDRVSLTAFGAAGLIVGLIWAVIAFNMKVIVKPYYLSDEVVNLDLIQRRNLHFWGAGLLIICSLITTFFGMMQERPTSTNGRSSEQ